MTVTKDMLLAELQSLLRMTSFEQTIATVRRTQARATSISEELAANAAKSAERRELLSSAVRQVGGVPDVVGQALGKVSAFATTQLNQVQTLQGALLGDLALEHQLRERTRYARTLAESLGYSQVIPVLDRLDVAHSATIEWLEQRLAEVGRTGTSALQATPVQAAVARVRGVVGAPFGAAAAGVNRVSGLLNRKAASAADAAQGVAGDAVESAKSAAGAAKAAAGSAASTATAAAGRARADVQDEVVEPAAAAASEAKDAVKDTVVDLTEQAETPTPDEHGAVGSLNDNTGVEPDGTTAPFAGYDKLSGDSVMRHVAESPDVPDLQVLLAYEQAHKARKGVVQAVEARLAELGSTPVGAGS